MKNRKSVFWGLLLITAGMLWLLNSMEITNIRIWWVISKFWPVIFIAWGADMLVEEVQFGKGKPSGVFVNVALLIGLGALLLGHTLDYYTLDLSFAWKLLIPVLIIIAGINIMVGGKTKAGGSHFVVMSGLEYKNPGWKLESGSFTAFMGGVDLDLTVADIPEGNTFLSLMAVMGGISIRVPGDLEVELSGTAVLGGVSLMKDSSGGIIGHKRMCRPGTSGKKLIINASVIMGGVEVK